MRILIVISSMGGGGAERVTANLANFWAKKGWKVTILTFAAPDVDDAYEISPCVERIHFRAGSQSTCTFIGRIITNIKRITFIRTVIKKLNPNIGIGMMTGANILLPLASLGLGLKIVGSERTHPPMYPIRPLLELSRKYLYGMNDTIVAVTTETAEWIRSHTNAKRVKVIPNAVQYPLPISNPRLAISETCSPLRKILLAVGRLSEEKQFNLLIEAFRLLSPLYSDWDLVILGEGPLRQNLEKQIANYGLHGRIFLPGRAGNVGEWYEYADIFVLCSRVEGFPNTLLEAMSYGMPCVSFDCDTGPRDIIQNEVNGLLIGDMTTEGLSRALNKLMGDHGMQERLSARASHVREKYSFREHIKRWERFF